MMTPLFAALSLFALGAADPGHAGGDKPAVTPAAAYKALVDGNARWAKGKPKHPDQTAKVRKDLAKGQSPQAIVVTCSDSRVAPELAFDQGIGRLFVVREAGNALDAHAIASIEYAVEHLSSKLIVVMGHDSCGAVKAALTTPEGSSAGSPSLDTLVKNVRTNMGTALTPADKEDPKVHKPVMANVESVTQQLATVSPVLKDRIASGEVAVVSAVYALDTGKVEFWNDAAVKPEAVVKAAK